MAALWFKETGSMAGACGQIIDTELAGVVVKRMHRHLARGNRSKCLNARAQCAMQQWASSLLRPANGFSMLFSPRAWLEEPAKAQSPGKADENRYSMQRIDCSLEINPCALFASETDLQLASELRLFYEKAKAAGIWPCDYELYRQSDGRVALIDFDKFSRWRKTPSGDEIVFPWGATITNPIYPWSSGN